MKHLDMVELKAGLDHILASPKDLGEVRMIVRRPDTDQREILESCQLDKLEGLVGDNWRTRGSGRTEDGSAHPEMQLNIMNARVIELLAAEHERWPLAGDQFYVDLDLGANNLPEGTRLSIGTALIEVTPEPHLGCNKFVDRFGSDAMQFVNSELGKAHRLRGLSAKVIQPGVVSVGDRIIKGSA